MLFYFKSFFLKSRFLTNSQSFKCESNEKISMLNLNSQNLKEKSLLFPALASNQEKVTNIKKSSSLRQSNVKLDYIKRLKLLILFIF
jgi:hypothetical protein